MQSTHPVIASIKAARKQVQAPVGRYGNLNNSPGGVHGSGGQFSGAKSILCQQFDPTMAPQQIYSPNLSTNQGAPC